MAQKKSIDLIISKREYEFPEVPNDIIPFKNFKTLCSDDTVIIAVIK